MRGGEVTEVTSLDDLSSNFFEGLTVVDFTATWCGPCKMIAPVYEQLSDDLEFKEVKFVKVDVDKAAEIAHKFDVAAMPTFVVLKDGEVIARLSGANGERLRELLRGAVESQVGGESASKMEGTDADKE